MLWTGKEIIVWQGYSTTTTISRDISAYDPHTATWRSLPSPSTPDAYLPYAIWDGSEVIAWSDSFSGGQATIAGARLNIVSGAWQSIAPFSAEGVCCPKWVWTGQELLFVMPGAHWAAYVPATDTWQLIDVPDASAQLLVSAGVSTVLWTGDQVLIWCGNVGQGIRFNPLTNSFRSITPLAAPSDRYNEAVVWTGSQMLVWGGEPETPVLQALSDGHAYDPSTDTWSILADQGAPSPRLNPAAVWTGTEMLIWGGFSQDSHILVDGAAYDSAANSWRPLPTSGAPTPRQLPEAVWTGTQLVIWGGTGDSGVRNNGYAYTPPAPHDARYYPQTSYRIDNVTIWDYFQHRGGVASFGYPTSRTLTFLGLTTQFFQRAVIQLTPSGQAQLLNLLDPPFLPYSSFNFSTVPLSDLSLVATAPPLSDQPALLAWIQSHAPDYLDGRPTLFSHTFLTTVPLAAAFPVGGDSGLLPGFDLEIWGLPTSAPLVDPHNSAFVFLRWQRGVMLYDQNCVCTQGVLLGDYLKAILTGENLPADLAGEAASSPFLDQYDPSAPSWVQNPTLLPGTDLTQAFVPE